MTATAPTTEEIARAESHHDYAMAHLDSVAYWEKHRSKKKVAHHLAIAYDREYQAAEIVAPFVGFEPSRSILMRSAATLAMRVGSQSSRLEAEGLVNRALAGNPPAEIARELREVLT